MSSSDLPRDTVSKESGFHLLPVTLCCHSPPLQKEPHAGPLSRKLSSPRPLSISHIPFRHEMSPPPKSLVHTPTAPAFRHHSPSHMLDDPKTVWTAINPVVPWPMETNSLLMPLVKRSESPPRPVLCGMTPDLSHSWPVPSTCPRSLAVRPELATSVAR